jgi:hypothetical protein
MEDVVNVEPVATDVVVDETMDINTDEEVLYEEDVEATELTEEQPAIEEQKEAVKNHLKKLNIKVDGKQIEREIDLANEAELVKILQMAELAQKRSQEAANLRKQQTEKESQLQEFLDALKTRPQDVLAHLGVNIHDVYEKIAEEEIKKAQMSPEEKRIKELEQELQKIKEAEDKLKKDSELKHKKMLEDKYSRELETELLDVLSQNKLPPSQVIIGKMTNMLSLALENGYDLKFKDVVGLVKNEWESEIKNSISGLSAEQLAQIITDQTKNDLITKLGAKKVVKKVVPSANNIQESMKEKEDFGTKKFRTKSADDLFKSL